MKRELIFRIGDDCADGVLLFEFCRSKKNGGIVYAQDSVDLHSIIWDGEKPNIIDLGNVKDSDEEAGE